MGLRPEGDGSGSLEPEPLHDAHAREECDRAQSGNLQRRTDGVRVDDSEHHAEQHEHGGHHGDGGGEEQAKLGGGQHVGSPFWSYVIIIHDIDFLSIFMTFLPKSPANLWTFGLLNPTGFGHK